MAKLFEIIFIGLIGNALSFPASTKRNCHNYPFPFVSREGWSAQPALSTTALEHPVPFVVIHHTYIPPECTTRTACANSMRAMQLTHQVTNGWVDIGYNFAIGGDGSVYEGRGWDAVGAHAVGYNAKSIGIVFIGDFVDEIPPKEQMNLAHELISTGVKLGHISKDYQLIGHRQVSATECPGQALFDEITTWDRFAHSFKK